MIRINTMNYYTAVINEGSELIVIYARNKFIAKALINDDAEHIQKISAVEAKKLVSRGIKQIS
nr:MAG TPA_asm: hypothetical protein [Caudoviricetes sp.]